MKLFYRFHVFTHKYVQINYPASEPEKLLIVVENFIKTQAKTFVKHIC